MTQLENAQIGSSSNHQIHDMRSYYEFHAKIYDLSRWSFLFKRKEIIKKAYSFHPEAKKILEVGCGTGANLPRLSNYYPTAHIYAMDVSKDMLKIANSKIQANKNNVSLIENAYSLGSTRFRERLDLILFSYSLSMINPQWEELLLQASFDLKAGGIIAIVDFYDSPFHWFKTHMGNNHVRMDAHFGPVLEGFFHTEFDQSYTAYGGIWEYFMYVGRKR